MSQGEHYEIVPWYMRGQPGVQDHRTIIVAEIGNNHEGSLGNVIHMIECSALAGVDAVKIQLHRAQHDRIRKWPKRFSYHPQDKTRKAYWKRMQFEYDDLDEIQKACDKMGVHLIASPFSIEAVKMLNQYDIWAYKIASGLVNDEKLLNEIKKETNRVILSTGMSDTREVNKAVCNLCDECLDDFELYVLQCATAYPTPVTQIGMNVCEVYSRNLIFKGGLSDHSGTIFPSVIAAYLGAHMVEVHVCFSKKQFGADISSSVTFDQLEQLVKGVSMAEQMRINPVNKDLVKPSQDAMESYR